MLVQLVKNTTDRMKLGAEEERRGIPAMLKYRFEVLPFHLSQVPRDPRFDNLSGEYSPEVFEKTYRFLNDIRKEEKEVMEQPRLPFMLLATTSTRKGMPVGIIRIF